MSGSFSRKTFVITYPDVTGGRDFFDREKYDVDVRKVDDENYKVDICLKAPVEKKVGEKSEKKT